MGFIGPLEDDEPDARCPDCGLDPLDETLHSDACPRVNTVGQIGPPWAPGPWAPWCDHSSPCLQPLGHDGPHDPPGGS